MKKITEKEKEQFINIYDKLDDIISKIVNLKSKYGDFQYKYDYIEWEYDNFCEIFNVEAIEKSHCSCCSDESNYDDVTWEEIFNVKSLEEKLKKEHEERLEAKRKEEEEKARKEKIAKEESEKAMYEKLKAKYE